MEDKKVLGFSPQLELNLQTPIKTSLPGQMGTWVFASGFGYPGWNLASWVLLFLFSSCCLMLCSSLFCTKNNSFRNRQKRVFKKFMSLINFAYEY